jgi:hypothetical protein
MSSSGFRQHLVNRVKVDFINISGAFGISAQIAAIDLQGNTVVLCRPILLSTVDSDSISVNVPSWITGPAPVSTNLPLFQIILRASVATTSAFIVPFTIRTWGYLTQPETNVF